MKTGAFVHNIADYARSHQLFQVGDKVLVGVSGGADSVALLRCLYELKYELGLQLYIAHVNHKLRKSADDDQVFVEQIASSLSLPVYIDVWKNGRKDHKGSLEERARKYRLAFFSDLLKKVKAHKVALAHHQNDLAETVLMRILRGTGLQGLRAIQPKVRIDGLMVVRPFLCCLKSDIVRYLDQKKMSYCEDETNTDERFYRNKIRHGLLHELREQYNPQIIPILSGLANSAALDYDFIAQQAHRSYKQLKKQSGVRKGQVCLDKLLFQKKHPCLRHMMIRLAVLEICGHTRAITLKHIEEIDHLLIHRPVKSLVHLPHGLDVVSDKKDLILRQKL
ncbi:MAG: tRNA lysidine(34) synthetase TilS [Candidatus Omnitrophica bacterium]|nr:tRNA lysidine(34) synthetase TilS [Candidatus Omnitrophota bacterium]